MGSVPTTVAGTREAGRYRFGCIVVDAVAHRLSRSGHAIPLEPKAFAVLLELLAHRGELVSRDQLLDAVWGHRHVTPGVLTRAIAQLRSAMDDDPHRPRYIQTQHSLGHRFIGHLDEEVLPAVDRAAPGPSDTTANARRPGSRERRSADRLAHRRWLMLAVLLAVLLAILVVAVLVQPVP